jgi:hypothetical protein
MAVGPDAGGFLHSDSSSDANVMPNLRLEHSLDALMELGESIRQPAGEGVRRLRGLSQGQR